MHIIQRIVALGAACVALGLASNSFAQIGAVNGSICRGLTPSDEAQFNRSIYGVQNTSSFLYNVTCPLPRVQGNAEPTIFYGTFYDRHSSNGVSCTLYRLNYDGNVVWSSNQTTGSWSWSPTTLNWTMPASSPLIFPYHYEAECQVPGYDGTTGGYSHVTSFHYL